MAPAPGTVPTAKPAVVVKVEPVSDDEELPPAADQINREFRGVKWVTTGRGFWPKWTKQPDHASMVKCLKEVLGAPSITVSKIAEGGFNKIYEVNRSGAHDPLILRVALPLDPHYKTQSDVGVLDWVGRYTAIPVPRVVASCAYRFSDQNPIGFEWILMTKIRGQPLHHEWRFMTLDTKAKLVRELAKHMAVLFRKRFKGIGNIYHAGSSRPTPGRIVSMPFFWEKRAQSHVRRLGPYKSSRQWLFERLSLAARDCDAILKPQHDPPNPPLVEVEAEDDEDDDMEDEDDEDVDMEDEDEDELERARRVRILIKKLRWMVTKTFPAGEAPGAEAEPSVIYHDDLSQSNIMVDSSGALTGIIDWECVSTVPLWKACEVPDFLNDELNTREVCPDPSLYLEGDVDTFYKRDLLIYELTQLRRVFFTEMGRLEPEWMTIYLGSRRERDVEEAVECCDNKPLWKVVERWVDEVTVKGANARTLAEVH
jgi:aminoglycoside phosphotransferase (APT) family kinase protein